MGDAILAVHRAALNVYVATGEHPNAVVLDHQTLREVIEEGASEGAPVVLKQGEWFVVGMLVLSASCRRALGRRIVLPVHADLGDVIQAKARPGAAA